MCIQTLRPELAVEDLDEAVFRGFARNNVVTIHLGLLAPSQNR